MITRRCSERRFFMRPDRETNNAFVYCLALATRKASVSIVCTGTMSNHYHAVVVDNWGRLPQFLEHFHKLYAKHQNALRGRWEAFWASEQTSVVELIQPKDVIEKMVYAITNPVAGHLVERVHHWPGVESLTAIDHNLPLTAAKPVRFFDPENGDLPDVIDLRFRRAPGVEHLSHAEYSKLLRDKVAEAEKKAATERREKGIKFLGRKGVLSIATKSYAPSVCRRWGHVLHRQDRESSGHRHDGRGLECVKVDHAQYAPHEPSMAPCLQVIAAGFRFVPSLPSPSEVPHARLGAVSLSGETCLGRFRPP